MKDFLSTFPTELPDDIENVVLPRETYLALIEAANSNVDTLRRADHVLDAAEVGLSQANKRIQQLSQWLESAEAAIAEKDEEIARLKATNTRDDNARAQRTKAMGYETIYARDAKGNKVAAVDVPVPPAERIKALCAEVSRLETALDLEHNRYLEARREIARLNEHLKESNNSLLDARQALTELNHAYERVRTTTQQLVKQKTELEKQLNELKSADNRPTQDCVARPSRVERLETEVALLKQEKASLRDELIKTRQDRDYWISLVRGVYNTTAVVADRK